MGNNETTDKLEALEDRLRTIERKLDVLWADIASVALFFLGLAICFKLGLSLMASIVLAGGLGLVSFTRSRAQIK